VTTQGPGRTMHWLPRLGGLALLAALSAGAGACKRQRHPPVASFTPPPPRAGFVERSGSGWRLSVPSTWRDAPPNDAGAWAVIDPQAADDFHAKVFVVTEPFAGESYDYAKASEAGLRREARAAVEPPREDVVDGDPTLILESYWAPSAPGPSGAAAAPVAYRTMQTALASRGTGYVITCSVSSSAFERYRSTCESILRSFAVER
jgi:hypothetical protein